MVNYNILLRIFHAVALLLRIFHAVALRVCPEIQKTGNIRTDKGRYRQDIENVVRAEESKYNRSRSVSGSYTYVGGDTAAFERSPVHGIFERQKFADDIGNRHFWCRGYYVDTVGKNKKAIEEYIRNQLQEDIANDQLTLKEYIDPFTGSKNK